MTEVAALDIRDLGHAYSGRPILSAFNLAVPVGSHTVLLGPSGSGKTTLINLATGLLTPDAGTIRIGGEPMTGSAAARDDLRRRRIGIRQAALFIFTPCRTSSSKCIPRCPSKLPQLAAATGISQKDIKLRSCLVTSALVPMQFQREAAAYFDVVSDFEGLERHFILEASAPANPSIST